MHIFKTLNQKKAKKRVKIFLVMLFVLVIKYLHKIPLENLGIRFIGLIVILTGFYSVYMPFIEQGGEYTWKTSDCTNVAPEFITPDMNCQVLELEKELPFDETRDGPEP